MRFTCVTWAEWFQWKPVSDSTYYWGISSAACLSLISKQLGPFLCWSISFSFFFFVICTHASLHNPLRDRLIRFQVISAQRGLNSDLCVFDLKLFFLLVCILFFWGGFCKKKVGYIFVFRSPVNFNCIISINVFTSENVNQWFAHEKRFHRPLNVANSFSIIAVRFIAATQQD